jgi:hypothetical protein
MPAIIQAPAEKIRLLKQLQDRVEQRENELLSGADVFALMGFVPNPGPQTRFLSLPDENIDVLYGGAVGGSKSTSLLLYALRACSRFPGLQAFWFRRSFPELEHSVLRLLARYGYASRLGCKWRADTHELRFPAGSVLTFSHAKNVQEASAFLSAEINLLIIDERTTLLPDVVDMLYTRVRSGQADVPCLGVRSATNPGEIGHSRVLAEFVEATGHGEYEILDANKRRRIFVQARASDTPQLGAEYIRNLQGLPEKLRKAYLEGDWTVFAGQVFDSWRYDRHVMHAFTLPDTWQRYMGIDWGHRAPWCALWGCLDPDGRVYFYRELYATQVGEGDQADRILAAEAPDEHVAMRFADDSMWNKLGDAKPIAEVYAEHGCHLTRAGKGPNSRITRVTRTRSFLAEGPACPHHRALGWDTCPMMHVFPGCENLIRTLPTLPHAKTGNPEDVDTDAEDHSYDAASYMLVNLGTGPEFLALDEPVSSLAAELGPWEQRGQFAYRPDEREPAWGSDDEDTSMRGRVQRSPFG